MAKSSLEDLYDLVHAMDPAEKRYFKQFAQFTARKATNRYMILFDYLNKMPSYDEAVVLKYLKKRELHSQQRSLVFHLFQLILRGIGEYEAGATRQNKLKELLKSARILLEKQQFNGCKKVLSRGRRMAEKLEDPFALLEIISLEKQWLIACEPRKLEATLEEKMAEEVKLVEQIQEVYELDHLHTRHGLLRKRTTLADSSEKMDLLRELTTSPVLGKERVPGSFQSYLYYHQILGYHQFMEKDYEVARDHFESVVHRWEGNPDRIEDHPGLYLKSLTDLLNACIHTRRLDSAKKIIEVIGKVPVRNQQDQFRLLNDTLYAQLLFFLNTGNFSQGGKLVKKVERMLGRYEGQMEEARKVSFFYNIAIFFFLYGDFSSSLKWINRIVQLPVNNLKRNTSDFSRILNLILHYELGNLELLEHLFRATKRYFKHYQRMGPFERVIFKLVGRMIEIPTGVELEKIWSHYHAELSGIVESNTAKNPDGIFEMIFWLDSKIKKVPIEEVFALAVKLQFVRT